jgi:hypothetical protein
MRTVYKYPLPLNDRVTLEIPRGAKPLYVAEQNGQLCLWALVDPEHVEEERGFYILGTGQRTTDDKTTQYVGTAICDGGRFVWHVFEAL